MCIGLLSRVPCVYFKQLYLSFHLYVSFHVSVGLFSNMCRSLIASYLACASSICMPPSVFLYISFRVCISLFLCVYMSLIASHLACASNLTLPAHCLSAVCACECV